MPHLRLEFTTNLPGNLASRELFSRFHRILAENGIVLGNCKTRAIPLTNYYVGDGAADEAFVHLDVRLLEGRTRDTKRQIGVHLLEALRSVYEHVHPRLQITVEVNDFAREGYFKYPEGTLPKSS